MNEVSKTLFIPLYGKAQVSSKGVILSDPTAERIWRAEAFPVRGKAKSKWLAYNMAMRARVFDDWTDDMLRADGGALVLHIGCGLDSRCLRVQERYANWIDADLPDVITLRKDHYAESAVYRMTALDASRPEQVARLPDAPAAIVVMEGLSMYLTNAQVSALFRALERKYARLHILMDVYTAFGARASRYKNPVNEVGVTRLYGVDDVSPLLDGTSIRLRTEHSFTPERLISELRPRERAFFRMMFAEKLYRRIYRLYELERT